MDVDAADDFIAKYAVHCVSHDVNGVAEASELDSLCERLTLCAAFEGMKVGDEKADAKGALRRKTVR